MNARDALPFARTAHILAGMQHRPRPLRQPADSARARAGLVPGCPGAAPLHDHALLPWRFHPAMRASDSMLQRV